MSVYITAVSGGNCVTKSGNVISNTKPQKSPGQLWTVERNEGHKNQIALRCNADGNYLRATAGNAYGAVGTGAKQWWQLEDGHAPGSYWMKSLDFPNAYLCNANGSYAENNKIYMWPRQENWTHALTFYLQNANAAGYLSRAEQDDGGASSAEASKMLEEVKKREAALAEKEAEAAKVTKLSEEAEKMMEDAKRKEAELAEREAQVSKASEQSGEAAKKAKELEEKEKTLAVSEKEYQAKLKALEEREKSQAGRGSSDASDGDDADAQERQKELETLDRERKEVAKKFAELEAREKALADKEKQVAKGPTVNGVNGTAGAGGDDALREENERLKQELAQAKRIGGGSSRFSLSQKAVGSSSASASRGAIPPPRRTLPERKLPPATLPGQKLPGTFSPDLLRRFEAGRAAMKT